MVGVGGGGGGGGGGGDEDSGILCHLQLTPTTLLSVLSVSVNLRYFNQSMNLNPPTF